VNFGLQYNSVVGLFPFAENTIKRNIYLGMLELLAFPQIAD
jgi:hypothetical protein